MASQSPMYRAFVEVVPEASGFTGALTGQVAAAGAAAGAAGGKAAAGGLLAGFGKAVPLIGAGIAALGIGDLIGDALSDGADYEQAFGAVEDVFEDASDTIVRFSKTSAKQLGLSATQALVGAKDFGIFGRAAGLLGEDLADFSTELLALGSDLAAFGNTTPEEAVVALGAGLRGESEPLRRYGVLLDDAKLRARAFELGIYDGNGALTSQQKILAASAEIFAQTGIQQGQFARESDTLAAKQAILAASWADISMQLGTAFLPVAQEVVDWMTAEMVPALEDFAEWLNKPETQQGIDAFLVGLREIGNFLRDWVVNPLLGTIGVVDAFVSLINGVSFEELKTKLLEIPGPLGWIIEAAYNTGEAIARFVGESIFNVKSFAREVGENVGAAISWFQQLPLHITSALVGAGSWLYQSGRAVIQGFINGISSMFEPIRKAVSGVLGFVAGFFPNSPAKHGPFSGSGWTALGNSGAAIAEQFAAGLEREHRLLQSVTGGLVQTAAPAPVAGRPVEMFINAAPGMSAETVGQVAAERLNYLLRGA